MKIGVSYGTATLLGLNCAKLQARPTTAYLIIGGTCKRRCAFCVRGNEGADRLSRITWPEYDSDFLSSLLLEKSNIFPRICFQMTQDSSSETEATLLKMIESLRATAIPISVSAGIRSGDFISSLLDAGVQRVAIPLDVASPSRYREIKKANYQQVLDSIFHFAQIFPNRITTHIIVGLGEEIADLAELFHQFKNRAIIYSLFAFTPIRGAELEHEKPPTLAYYRKVQLLKWLIDNGLESCFEIDEGIIKFNKKKIYIICGDSSDFSAAFRTSGCRDCNRPFYNEHPGEIPYNYPEPLEETEAAQALELAFS